MYTGLLYIYEISNKKGVLLLYKMFGWTEPFGDYLLIAVFQRRRLHHNFLTQPIHHHLVLHVGYPRSVIECIEPAKVEEYCT